MFSCWPNNLQGFPEIVDQLSVNFLERGFFDAMDVALVAAAPGRNIVERKSFSVDETPRQKREAEVDPAMRTESGRLASSQAVDALASPRDVKFSEKTNVTVYSFWLSVFWEARGGQAQPRG